MKDGKEEVVRSTGKGKALQVMATGNDHERKRKNMFPQEIEYQDLSSSCYLFFVITEGFFGGNIWRQVVQETPEAVLLFPSVDSTSRLRHHWIPYHPWIPDRCPVHLQRMQEFDRFVRHQREAERANLVIEEESPHLKEEQEESMRERYWKR